MKTTQQNQAVAGPEMEKFFAVKNRGREARQRFWKQLPDFLFEKLLPFLLLGVVIIAVLVGFGISLVGGSREFALDKRVAVLEQAQQEVSRQSSQAVAEVEWFKLVRESELPSQREQVLQILHRLEVLEHPPKTNEIQNEGMFFYFTNTVATNLIWTIHTHDF